MVDWKRLGMTAFLLQGVAKEDQELGDRYRGTCRSCLPSACQSVTRLLSTNTERMLNIFTYLLNSLTQTLVPLSA